MTPHNRYFKKLIRFIDHHHEMNHMKTSVTHDASTWFATVLRA